MCDDKDFFFPAWLLQTFVQIHGVMRCTELSTVIDPCLIFFLIFSNLDFFFYYYYFGDYHISFFNEKCNWTIAIKLLTNRIILAIVPLKNVGWLSEVNILVVATDYSGFDFKGFVLECVRGDCAGKGSGFLFHLFPPCCGTELWLNESLCHSKKVCFAGTKSAAKVLTFPTSDVCWCAQSHGSKKCTGLSL